MKISVREMVIFSMLGALMYVSKMLMEFAPNVHLLGVFTVTFTIVYRWKALYPIYIFVFLVGFFNGFSIWWIPYLYLWAVLWGMTMLLPKKMPNKVRPIVYMVVCALHGYLYGTLYAPFQAICFGLNFKGMVAWIVAGLPWDCIHGTSNLIAGILIVQLATLLGKLEKNPQNL